MSARRSTVLRASLTGLTLVLALALAPLLRTSGTPQISLADATTNPVTPGDFQGYGFDQCSAPSQSTMDAWLRSSPYLAVGIYISGNSRACRSQPNLTTTWIHNQLARGWKLLPITLGPQASCNSRYPRYGSSIDPRINPTPGSLGKYGRARNQARAEAAKTASAAAALGITKGSTLWYDLEAFDIKNTGCRESALSFLSAYTDALHADGYVSGVYSSAGSGIVALDDVRRTRPSAYTLPDRIWIARWDGNANTSTTYIPDTGWNPGRRAKQYLGGHTETWGGVRINIDRDFLSLGRGSYSPKTYPCGGVDLDLRSFPAISSANAAQHPGTVKALQCMLKFRGLYAGKVNGRYNTATIAAVRQWRTSHGLGSATSNLVSASFWAAFLSAGHKPVLKVGSAGQDVRRLQRALNGVYPRRLLPVTGVYDSGTRAVVTTYQRQHGMSQTGIVVNGLWNRLQAGGA
ncbi:glycoside hydrolase domain-containing protein [Nocardioides montaniterrae]